MVGGGSIIHRVSNREPIALGDDSIVEKNEYATSTEYEMATRTLESSQYHKVDNQFFASSGPKKNSLQNIVQQFGTMMKDAHESQHMIRIS